MASPEAPLPTPLPPPEQLADAALDSGAPVRLLVTPLREGRRTLGVIVVALPLILIGVVVNNAIVLVAAAGLAAAGPVLADIPNYTDSQPMMLIGEVIG